MWNNAAWSGIDTRSFIQISESVRDSQRLVFAQSLVQKENFFSFDIITFTDTLRPFPLGEQLYTVFVIIIFQYNACYKSNESK